MYINIIINFSDRAYKDCTNGEPRVVLDDIQHLRTYANEMEPQSISTFISTFNPSIEQSFNSAVEQVSQEPSQSTSAFYSTFNPITENFNVPVEAPFDDLIKLNNAGNLTVPASFIIHTIKNNKDILQETLLQTLPDEVILLIWQSNFFQDLFK